MIDLKYKGEKGFSARLSVYYKSFNNLLKSLESDSGFSQCYGGESYGIESSLETNLFGLDAKVSYVWSRAQRTFRGVEYDANFDQRHRIQISCFRELGKGWKFGAYWIFHTGQPYDPGRYLALYRGVDYSLFHNYRSYNVFGVFETDVPRGRIRYPLYHRLDLKISKTISGAKYQSSFYLAIRNAYMKKNVLYYRNIEYQPVSPKEKWVDPNLERDPFYLPLIPSIGFQIEF